MKENYLKACERRDKKCFVLIDNNEGSSKMNNSHNYSFLHNAGDGQITQHFAFEKGGSGIKTTEFQNNPTNTKSTMGSTEAGFSHK